MRRLMAMTAFALFLAVPVWAQRGGGHAGGHGFSGGHGGGFAGHGGFSGGHHGGGGHFSGGMHSGLSHSFQHSSRSGFSRGPFLHDGFRGDRFRDRGFRFHNRGFRNNCFGFGCWGGWWGYYDPWLWGWWDHSDSSYYEGYDRNLAIANEMNQQSLEQQRMLRQEQAEGDQDVYTSAPRRSSGTADDPPGAAVMPATVLVFRDQHKQEIQNYAIVGHTLWNFAPRHTEKIPLADLDLAATVQANDALGTPFRVPGVNEAQ